MTLTDRLSSIIPTLAQGGQSVPIWTLVAATSLGALVGFQPGANATLGDRLGHPIFGALTNNLVGLTVLCLLLLVLTQVTQITPTLSNARSTPWWSWLGGAMGASFVIASILLAPRMGIALLFTCMLLGQLSVSVVIDNFGLVGQPKKPVNWGRFLGMGLVIAGLFVNYAATGKR